METTVWEGVGHSVDTAWLELVGRIGVQVLVVLLAALLIRAFLRRHRYRAVDVLSPADLDRVHAALVEAERRTVGEVLPVVLERSDAHPGASWLSAAVTTLVGSAFLVPWLPWERPLFLLAAQAALGGLGFLLARVLPDFRRLFVREARATEMAAEQALQEFHRYGLHGTERRTGVLLFVSLFERRVVVLADEGIDAPVEGSPWIETDRAILEGIRGDSLADGLVAGIRRAGGVLAEHAPAEGGERNEVPDRVIVRAE